MASLAEGCPFLPLPEVSPPVAFEDPGMTEGSSNWPAGVRRRPPSELKVSRRKKFVKLSSPYSLTFAQVDAAELDAIRMAGRAGIGEGDRPYLVKLAGEPGALDPLNEDRLDDVLSIGGGNMEVDGVLATDAVGVSSAPPCWLPDPEATASSLRRSLTLVITDSVSLAFDSLRNGRGRL